MAYCALTGRYSDDVDGTIPVTYVTVLGCYKFTTVNVLVRSETLLV